MCATSSLEAKDAIVGQAAIFAELIANHARLSAAPTAPRQTKAIAFRDLLEEFVRIHKACTQDEAKVATANRQKLQTFINGYDLVVEVWRRHQAETADEFDILKVLDLTHDENRHSMMLAWLLDRDMLRHGTHAQGNLGFRLFLEALKLPLELADTPYWVRREVSGETSRVDIEIAARGRFLIHIENKIGSNEGPRQTHREAEDMRRRAEVLGIAPCANGGYVLGLFLTPSGKPPENSVFRRISWRQIAKVVAEFAEKARPPEVKLFAKHYARTLRRFIVEESQEEDPDRGQHTV
jgi:hypothetical protein